MEADARATVGKELALRERIHAARQVARTEEGHDASDVGLERRGDHVPVQANVLVELLRDSRRQIELGDFIARLRRELDATLDLTDLIGVLVDRSNIAGPELLAESPEFLDQRVEDALTLLHSLCANFGRGAAAEQPLEDDLRVQLHRERTGP